MGSETAKLPHQHRARRQRNPHGALQGPRREPLLQKAETDFPEGAAVFSFAPEDTRALPFGNYRYDVRLTDREGNVFTIVTAGDFTVLEAIADA